MADEREDTLGGDDEREYGGGGEIEEAEIETDAEGDGEGEDAGAGDADDGEGQEEGEEGEGRVLERPEPRRPESRYQRNERRAREAEAKASALEERLARVENQRSQPDPEALRRAEAEELERLRLMEPAEALDYVRRQERQRLGMYIAGVEGRMLDRQDKADFDAQARSNQTLRRLAPEVERHIAQARQQGNFQLTREVVADLLIGREIRLRRDSAVPGQRRAGQRRVAAQTTRPGSGRGEAARGNRVRQDSDEALLRGTTVGDI